MELKKPFNASVVLNRSKGEPKESQLLGEPKVDRGRINPDLQCNTSGREEGLLEASQRLEGARGGGGPKVAKSTLKGRGFGDPRRDSLTAGDTGTLPAKGKTHRKVVRKGETHNRTGDRVVGGVVRDSHRGREKRMRGNRGRKEKPIKPRRAGIRRKGVSSNVKMGVSVMGGID
jgi:hypothetical protein